MSVVDVFRDGPDKSAIDARTDFWTHLWAAAELWLDHCMEPHARGFLAEASEIFTGVAEDRGATLEPNWLYRLYSNKGRLLYVGVTKNPQARIAAHKRRFGTLLDTWTLHEYPDRAAVLAAEAEAIDSEYPAFNVEHPQVTA